MVLEINYCKEYPKPYPIQIRHVQYNECDVTWYFQISRWHQSTLDIKLKINSQECFLENELCYLTFFSLVWYCSSMIQSSFPQTYWSITKKQIVTLVSSSTFNFTGCPVLWTPNPSLMHTALKPHYIERSSKMNRDLFSNQSKLF